MEQPAVEAVGVERKTEGEINVYAVFKYGARSLTVNAVFQSPLHPRHTAGEREKNVSPPLLPYPTQLALQLFVTVVTACTQTPSRPPLPR